MRSKKSRARGLVQRTSCSASNLPVPTIISPEKIDSGTSGFSAAGREQPKNSAQRRSAEEKALAQDGRARAMAFAVSVGVSWPTHHTHDLVLSVIAAFESYR